MKKRIKKENVIIAVVTLSGFVAMLLLIFPQKRFHNSIEDIKKETSPMFDSVSNRMAQENSLMSRITLLLHKNESKLAMQVVDSAIRDNPGKGIYHTFKGMVYAYDKHYDEALGEYDLSIQLNKNAFPLVLGKKAETFTKIGSYMEAIECYKKAAELNGDYYFDLASVFELLNKKDSALKYYLIYQNSYPTDSTVIKKIKALSDNF